MTSKKILLLGSGLMAEPVIDYLLRRPEVTHINKYIVLTNNFLEFYNFSK